MRAKLFGAAALLLLTSAARAEPIPQANLDADQKVCIAHCTRDGYERGYCTQYCGCTFKQVSAQFTFEEYNASRAAARQNQEPPKPLVDRMIAISDACMAGIK